MIIFAAVNVKMALATKVKMETTLFGTLFACLAGRQGKENDLSDVTWAACMACPGLQEAFVRFFFPDAAGGVEAFEREHVQGGSRPDFYLRMGGEVYLIEIKLYDPHHHFGQYEQDFGIPASHLGYITNYPLQKEGYTVRTWEELYYYLHRLLPADGEERNVWLAYLAYMKQVCSIYKRPEKMDLKGMYSLYAFMQELRRLVNRDTETYHAEWYGSKQDTHGGGNRFVAMRDGAAGCYFSLKYKHAPIAESWVWIGVYFKEESPSICLCFENCDGWGKPVCDLLPREKAPAVAVGDYAGVPYYDSGSLWFNLSDARLAEFDASDFDRQVEILGAFIDEVARTVAKEINDNNFN